ncbi:MAG: hypothetical protein BMS9Abin05_2397 [Rhodothermia bacterium]|nr:MAG: hypothetical protein BMS9Abin05_2397 [Rhodothermia bacterium]
MKKLILASLLSILNLGFGVGSDVAYADEYKLVYSKEDGLCNYARDVLNDDLKRNGFVASPLHDPFGDIKWTRMRNSYVNSFHATFDIDNDGHKEVVIRVSSSVNDVIETNMLLIYEKLDLRRRFTSKTYASHRESIDLDGAVYELTACKDNPACFPNGIDWVRDWKVRSMWAAFIIHPFFYKNKTYISIRDWQPPGRPRWLVIASYFGGKVRDRGREPSAPSIDPDAIEDQCYLRRVSN